VSQVRKGRSNGVRRSIFALLGISLSVCGLAYVFRDIIFGNVSVGEHFKELFASTDRIEILPMLGSVALYWLCLIVLRSLLVRHLLKSVGDLRWVQAYRYICIGFLANNVLPLRAGEVARSAAIHKGANLSFPSVVGSLAVERMLDMTLLAVIALAAIQVAPLPGSVRTVSIFLSVLLGIGFITLIILARRRRGEEQPKKDRGLRTRLRNIWIRFSAGFGALKDTRGTLIAVGLSICIWAVALATMMLRLEAFGLPSSLSFGLVLLTCIGFGVAVPSAPGYVGVYHAAIMFALVEGFGVEPVIAVAFSWFSWLLDVGVSSVTGAISLSIEGLKLGELKEADSGPATE
jgi:uncharacterized protein (TIRG00374 family)